MNDHDANRSLFAELAARRKRSAGLHERAIERGIATPPAASVGFGDSDSAPTAEASPAVEPEDVVAPASEPLPTATSTAVIPADEDVHAEALEIAAAEIPPQPEEASTPTEREGINDAAAEPSEGSSAEANDVSKGPESIENAHVESEPLFGPEPETPELEESVVEAERLADQIGQVVDIHSLPKTKPTRVLTKAAKLEADERGENEGKPSQPSSVESCAPSGPASPPKKKKRVTLLDSYFKGL